MMKTWTLEVLIECDGDQDAESLTMGLCVLEVRGSDVDDEFMVCWKYEKTEMACIETLKIDKWMDVVA